MTGFIARLDVPAASDTALGAAFTEDMIVNIRLCNRNAANAKVRVAITSGGAPAAADWIEYDTTILPNGVLENTALAVSVNERIYVRSDIANVSARAHGIPVI